MNENINWQEILKISKGCSFLGHVIIQGNVGVLKKIYSTIWQENPAIIEMISSLQNCITSVEIKNDDGGIYDPEFLYYWGMTCLGEQSNLVYKNTDIARNCFEKILNAVPNAEARLAYINLLESDEPAKSESNVRSIDVLRRWAGRQDFFSNIVLARIVFDQFLDQVEENNLELSRVATDKSEKVTLELPTMLIQLLHLPCSWHHPVAVRFWNEIMDYMGTSSAMDMRWDTTYMNEDILYDYKPIQICK